MTTYPRQAAARPPHYLLLPLHAASQKRPPQVETRKTGATQSISKAVRGLPIVERRGSIVPGLHRVPCPFAKRQIWRHLLGLVRTSVNPLSTTGALDSGAEGRLAERPIKGHVPTSLQPPGASQE